MTDIGVENFNRRRQKDLLLFFTGCKGAVSRRRWGAGKNSIRKHMVTILFGIEEKNLLIRESQSPF